MPPGHGNKVYSRTDVQRINHLPENKAPDPSRKPIIKAGEVGDLEVTFQSSSDALDKEDASDALTPGTIGFELFTNTAMQPSSPSTIQQIQLANPTLPGHIEREKNSHA